MVRRHQLDGGTAQDTHAVELTAIEKHLPEPQIVHRGRQRPGSAGIVAWFGGYIDHADLLAGCRIDSLGLRKTRHLGRGQPEACVDHLQWLEQALVQEDAPS